MALPSPRRAPGQRPPAERTRLQCFERLIPQSSEEVNNYSDRMTRCNCKDFATRTWRLHRDQDLTRNGDLRRRRTAGRYPAMVNRNLRSSLDIETFVPNRCDIARPHLPEFIGSHGPVDATSHLDLPCDVRGQTKSPSRKAKQEDPCHSRSPAA